MKQRKGGYFMDDIDSRITACPSPTPFYQTGQLFSTFHDAVGSSNLFTRMGFENPADNKKTMYLENVSGGIRIVPPTTPSDYQATLSVYIYETLFTSEGTVTPVNRNLGSTIASTIIVSRSPRTLVDPSSKSLSLTRHPTGEFSLNFGGQIIVPPGHYLYMVFLTSLSSSIEGYLSTTFTWYEL